MHVSDFLGGWQWQSTVLARILPTYEGRASRHVMASGGHLLATELSENSLVE